MSLRRCFGPDFSIGHLLIIVVFRADTLVLQPATSPKRGGVWRARQARTGFSNKLAVVLHAAVRPQGALRAAFTGPFKPGKNAQKQGYGEGSSSIERVKNGMEGRGRSQILF